MFTQIRVFSRIFDDSCINEIYIISCLPHQNNIQFFAWSIVYILHLFLWEDNFKIPTQDKCACSKNKIVPPHLFSTKTFLRSILPKKYKPKFISTNAYCYSLIIKAFFKTYKNLLRNGSTRISSRTFSACSMSFFLTHCIPKFENCTVIVSVGICNVHTPFLQPSLPTKLWGCGLK